MSNKRTVQHRVQREGSQELAKLRQENERLRRQVARLERENERLRGEPEPVAVPEPARPKPKRCPECGTKPILFTTPRNKVIYRCPGCGLDLTRR